MAERLNLLGSYIQYGLEIAHNSYGGIEDIHQWFNQMWLNTRVKIPHVNLNTDRCHEEWLSKAAKTLSTLLPKSPTSPSEELVRWSYLPDMSTLNKTFIKMTYYAFTKFTEPPLEEIYQFFRLRMTLFSIIYSLYKQSPKTEIFEKNVKLFFNQLYKTNFYDNQEDTFKLPRRRKLGAASEAFTYAALLSAFPNKQISPSTPLQDKAGADFFIEGPSKITPVSIKTCNPFLNPHVNKQSINLKIPNCPPFHIPQSFPGLYIEISPENIAHLQKTTSLLLHLI